MMKTLITLLLLTLPVVAQNEPIRHPVADSGFYIRGAQIVTETSGAFAGNASFVWDTEKPKYRTHTCIVTKVYDGDNIRCKARIGRTEKFYNLRIIAIDAPEVRGKQPYYEESRDILREIVLNKPVTFELRGYDSIWKCHTVRVYFNGDDVGLDLVRRGAAWFYPQYARTLTEDEKRQYREAQGKAKGGGLGFWGNENPIPPQDWRKGRR